MVKEVASEAEDISDAFVTLCVHSGIAAADAICGSRLGEYRTTANHADALALLNKVDGALAKHLDTLLKMKTTAGYGYSPITPERATKAERAMAALLIASAEV